MRFTLASILLLIGISVCAQTVLTIEGETYTNADDTWSGVNTPRTEPTVFTFKNNSITSINRYGYMLQAGDEVASVNNNNLDGALITGNKFAWSGTDMTIITHGLFTGHNINVVIKYNYLDHVPMAIIRKSTTNMSNTASGVAYNIIKSPNVGIVIKGMSGVCIYNNTLYQDRNTSETGRGLIDIYTNSSSSPMSVSHGTKIYNNIFYTKHETYCINVMDQESLTDFESDYNVFYCETGSPKFNAGGSVKTFAQWQALGYDTHSVVINPNFKDFVNFVPAARLDYGKDLGSEWKGGLSVNAKWGTTDPATTSQNDKWQVGAVIHAAPVEVVIPVPLYSGSIIANNTPAILEMTYDLTLANIVPTVSAFTVKVNTVTRSVSSVAISGTKVLLTLPSPVVYGDVVTVAYSKPASNPLQTAAGGQATSFASQNVINNVDAPNPIYVSSVIENANPSRLEMTYNLTLANITPITSAFTVKVNASTRTVSAIAISGTKVFLTLASPVVYGDVVTIAYTKPTSNPLQTTESGQAASITVQIVTNNCSQPANQPPVVNISSPTKSTSFISPATITIDATASDTDGTISKVEFYNGTIKLGERTVSPYSFTWKDVIEGTYTITAIATDNSNSKTVSDPVTAVVEKAAPAVNQLPVVTISSPQNESLFEAPATITLTADASDADGVVSKVEYFNGNLKIGESFSAPFEVSLECTKAGTYDIKAVVTDNLNAASVSATVKISVTLKNNYPDIINLYPNPNFGRFSIDLSSPLPDVENTVTITNLLGHTVYYGALEEEEHTMQFDLSHTPTGKYILIITSGNRIVTTKKFIKN